MTERMQVPDSVPEGRPASDEDSTGYLAPSWFCDSDDDDVAEFAAVTVTGAVGDAERAAALFGVVRDQVRYDPYTFDLSPRALRASSALRSGGTWCVPKRCC